MIKENDWVEALELRNNGLRKELRENRRLIARAEDFIKAIEKHINSINQVFNSCLKPEAGIAWDPESGMPYVEISVFVHSSDGGLDKAVREELRRYYRYIRLVNKVDFWDKIVLNLVPEAKAEDASE